jgi:hypothetical protein
MFFRMDRSRPPCIPTGVAQWRSWPLRHAKPPSKSLPVMDAPVNNLKPKCFMHMLRRLVVEPRVRCHLDASMTPSPIFIRWCSETNQPSTNPTGILVSQPSACERRPTSKKPIKSPESVSATRIERGMVEFDAPERAASSSCLSSSTDSCGHNSCRMRESCSWSVGTPGLTRISISLVILLVE